MSADLFSAVLIGLVSSAHCLGMCGGVTMALGLQHHGFGHLLGYNLGRISTYALLGVLIGAGLSWLPAAAMPALRLIAAILLILIALYYLNIAAWITRLERLALPLWRRVQPLTRRWLPAKNPLQAYRLGLVWGLLPCGLVYTALGFAGTAANPLSSGLLMLAFGAGTLPSMLATGVFSQQFKKGMNHSLVRLLIGILLLIMALWMASHSLPGGH
ncbi:MAG: sulfite exporter TauE/SafE family protein [Saccharospirillum sp.]|nr:sulfite exporter TauE/SafE family protein [Saccharospirillum sp.]